MYSSLLTACSLIIIMGCSSNSSQRQEKASTPNALDFQQHEKLKLGFTTQNFAEVAPVSLANAKQSIDYAAEQGFSWLELRDPDAILTLEESKEIAAYAREKKVEVAYAIQKGLLDDDFWDTFEKGVRNAAVFEGPKTFRSLAGGQEFNANTEKKGWNEAELLQIVTYADSAAAIAGEMDLQFVIENGTEPLYGKEGQYFGFADIFERAGNQLGWQFDTANPFSVSRVHPAADSVTAYLRDNVHNLYYIHLKSAQNGKPQTALMDNPIAFEEVFQILDRHNIPYVAIELQAVDEKNQAYKNMEESVEFLREKGLIINHQL